MSNYMPPQQQQQQAGPGMPAVGVQAAEVRSSKAYACVCFSHVHPKASLGLAGHASKISA